MKAATLEDVKTRLMDYLTDLIKQALDPYATQFKGCFQLPGLKRRLGCLIKELASIIDYRNSNTGKSRETKISMLDISKAYAHKMCSAINEDMFDLYATNIAESFFLIDFNAFSEQIASELQTAFGRWQLLAL